MSVTDWVETLVVTAFGGTDKGRKEARRYAKKLNEAVAAFYAESE